jgi:probable HAF family extracellular repeat protein
VQSSLPTRNIWIRDRSHYGVELGKEVIEYKKKEKRTISEEIIMTSMRRIFCGLAVSTLLLSAGAAFAANYRFTSIDFPNATQTLAYGVNASGQVVGAYTDAKGKGHGFLKVGNDYTPIDYLGAIETDAYGTNTSGQVVGIYRDANGNVHGFLLSGGVYTSIDFPNASETEADIINASGQIVGFYRNAIGTKHSFKATPIRLSFLLLLLLDD